MRSIKELVILHEKTIDEHLRFRLYDKGTYADGKKISTFKAAQGEVYSNFTIRVKKEQGQPSDIVTLTDTGDLYRSFAVKANNSSFLVEYEDKKPDGKVSDNIPNLDEAIMLGDEGVLGLQELIINDLRDDFKQEAREAIFNGFE